MSGLTVGAGEVPPFQQGCVERGQRSVKEGLASIGGMPGGVGEQVHLQKGLEEVAQHLAGPAHPRPPCKLVSVLCLKEPQKYQEKKIKYFKSQKLAKIDKQSQSEELVGCRSEPGGWGGWGPDASVQLPFVLIT